MLHKVQGKRVRGRGNGDENAKSGQRYPRASRLKPDEEDRREKQPRNRAGQTGENRKAIPEKARDEM